MVTFPDRGAVLCAAVALALVVWPFTRNSAARLAALYPSPPSPRRAAQGLRVRRSWLLALVLLPVATLLGPACALAAGLFFAAGWCHRRVSVRAKAETAAAHAMAEAIRMMVAELRTGAPAAFAAESAAADASGQAAVTMRTLAGIARLGGDFPVDELGARDRDRRAIAKAWSLSRRHGLPLAGLLDAVRRDILAVARAAARADANMAGPRASAAVLAMLPGLGLLLGEAMGAGPLHVLTGTASGQVLLVLGALLILAGVTWSARLTSPASPR